MGSLEFKNVWKRYGSVEAVRDVSLSVEEGEFVSILGPSGCGKSSSLRMIAGLEFISEGDILLDGQRLNDLQPRHRDIAMVFESYALYPQKNVYENLANPLRLRKVSRKELDQRVRDTAKLLEISELLERRPSQLSGGQKQRVAIGRALVRKPKLFLFDEPIAHLDAKLRARMRGELKHVQRNLETTTVYVTHDQLEAMSMADRIAVMRDGVLQQFATPQEVFNKPANVWVATFVGDPPMNVLEGALTTADGVLTVNAADFCIEVPQAMWPALKGPLVTTPRVVVGVRPDAMTLSTTPDDDHPVTGVIYAVQLLGNIELIDVRVGDTRVLVKAALGTVRSADINKKIHLGYRPDELYFFDEATGLAVT